MKTFKVRENEHGELIVTVKSGFALRLHADEFSECIFVHNVTPGDALDVVTISAKGKAEIKASRTTGFYRAGSP